MHYNIRTVKILSTCSITRIISIQSVCGISLPPAMAILLVMGLVIHCKKTSAKASLQCQTCGQMVNAEEMFKFYKTEIRGTEFIYIRKETMVGVWETLSNRFSRAKTILGKRSFHQFIPLSMEK